MCITNIFVDIYCVFSTQNDEAYMVLLCGNAFEISNFFCKWQCTVISMLQCGVGGMAGEGDIYRHT